MKTMFVANEGNTKKRFQKPNILRKRPKPPPKPSIPPVLESPNVKNLVTTFTALDQQMNMYTQCQKKNSQPIQRMVLDNNVDNDECSIGELYQIDGNVETDRSLAVTCDVLTSNNEDNVFKSINVESFINNSEMEQLVSQADVENELGARKQDWCLDFINDAEEIIIEDIDGSHLGSLRLTTAPIANSESPSTETSSQPTHTSTEPTKNITLEYLNCTVNFKCDIANCTKWFRSEEALNKHKTTHKSKAGDKTNKPVIIECPVKKISSNGEEEPCGVNCSTKNDLIKHLNEAHDPEDAMYICSECSRRFYWAAGLRAHSRAHLAGARSWACGWAGCGRAFPQRCRLREHMRAHTGDKPYPCRHPNCGWSFRTASKLLRHARRHTGERMHTCSECGRAFRRREHLRDHAARHHAPRTACTHAGCQKTFTSLIALNSHVEKVHKEESALAAAAIATEDNTSHNAELLPQIKHEDTFMVSLSSPALETHTLTEVTSIPTLPSVMPAAVAGMTSPALAVNSPRAARTHCTWPFSMDEPAAFEHNVEEYVLEEDVQVEMSEGSESKIYTIRSDLFLHGNVLNNEDSEQMCGATVVVGAAGEEGEGDEQGDGRGVGAGVGLGEGEGGSGGGPLVVGADSLLDAHPTIDLMQEELLYTDAAVDESSFQVYLLNGDDLT